MARTESSLMGNCILISTSDFSCILYYTSLYSHTSVCLGCTEKLFDMILLDNLKKPQQQQTTKYTEKKKGIAADMFSR